MSNILLETDSYKFTHWKQYDPDTEFVYSYFEARKGAKFDETVFFGLQRILIDHFEGQVVTRAKIERARVISRYHFGNDDMFNFEGWEYILNVHNGYLPLRIRAVPEGTVVPVGNVLMTIENTDPHCAWLTNYVESILMHVWYPSTVATLSRHIIQDVIKPYWDATVDDDNLGGLLFALHDFGYRGATSEQAAMIGGMAHLIHSRGTDNVPALDSACLYYDADLKTLGFSVPATEHSVMTSEGKLREFKVVERCLDRFPTGILSVVGDSFDIYEFVRVIGAQNFKLAITTRDGVFVVRPDSTTPEHPTPEDLVMWILEQLWASYGGTLNSKGFRVLDPHVRVIWGDGIDELGIEKILKRMLIANFSAENIVFGMGGNLLQKGIDRDTQRCAIKAAEIQRAGVRYEVQKNPLDQSKASKKGRLMLIRDEARFATTPQGFMHEACDVLQTVFENGKLVKGYTFDQVRENAAA